MKKLLLSVLLILILFAVFTPKASAYDLDVFDESIGELRDGISPEVRDKLSEMGWTDDLSASGELSLSALTEQLTAEIGSALGGPLSSLAVSLCILILSSIADGCAHSLRYTEAREVLSAAASLLIVSALLSPMTSLISGAVSVISAASSLMLLYVPVMAGIMAFSGRVIRSGGYLTTVMTASQAIAQLCSRFLSPLLKAMLALSAASGIGAMSRLRGLCEMVNSFVKWTLAFMMTIFTAVISLQAVASSAADTVGSRAARFALSSFVPLVGSAISEAYRAIQGSVDLLRSGVGVFVMIAMLLTFMQLIVQSAMWQLSIRLSRYAAEALGVESPAAVLGSVSSVLSALIAVTVCVMAVCVISTGVLISAGGAQ